MLHVLLISDESAPDDPGRIADAARYGLPDGICNIPNLQAVLPQLAACRVSVLHHTQIARAAALNADCAVLSGRFSAVVLSQVDAEYGALLAWLRQTQLPVFGICMGMQLLCAAFGGRIRRMRAPEGEFGFTALTPASAAAEAMRSFSCLELHRYEIEAAPETFDLLASSEKCRVQLVRHKTRPLMGSQFHPELFAPAHPDGAALLQRFLQRCGKT